jgi:hypothetical protein
VKARVSQLLEMWSFESPERVPVVVLVILVRLDFGGLCSFLVSFSFLWFWQENTPKRFRRERVRRSCRWWRGLAMPLFFYQSLRLYLRCSAAL